MATEPTAGERSEQGFTLIEVLVAMVILAVGLLALESLGIGAARSIAAAEAKNYMVAVSTTAMEQVHRQIRTSANPAAVSGSCFTDGATRLYVCTTVETSSTSGVPTGTARVTVTARKNSTRDTYTMTSYVFDPQLP